MKTLLYLIFLAICVVIGVFYFRFNSDFFMNLAAFMLFASALLGILALILAGTFLKALVIIFAAIGIFIYLENPEFGRYINMLYNIGLMTIHDTAIEVAAKTAILGEECNECTDSVCIEPVCEDAPQ